MISAEKMKRLSNNIRLDERSLTLLSSGRDSVGEIFLYDGKICRGVKAESVSFVRELLKSGLAAELTAQSLFPKTKITRLYTSQYPLVLEHERIKTLTYPYEWSFEMLRDAALTALKVNTIAEKYGYQTIDAHPANIMFNFTTPKFIDLGSFIKLEKAGSWFASEEFIQRFYYPLSLWSSGFEFIATKALLPRVGAISHLEYHRIINPWARLLPRVIYSRLLNTYFPFSRVAGIPEPLLQSRLHPRLFSVLIWMKKNKLLPFQNFNTKKYIDRILKLKSPSRSYWSNYQSSGKGVADDRFKKVGEILKQRGIKSVVDFASNEGTFTAYLLKKGIAENAVCLDYDNQAIDSLYRRIKKKGTQVAPIVQNAVIPMTAKAHSSLEERFRADAVVALAITHHLLLTQNYPIEKILSSIVSFAEKYVLVEFMPLGLWNGKFAPPVPEWYNQQWFEEKLSNFCQVEQVVELGKNRILFVGKVRQITSV